MLRILDLAAGLAIMLAALGAWRRSRALAVLCVSTAAAWFAGDALPGLALIHRPLLAHALLVSVGRASAAAKVVVAALWIEALVPAANHRGIVAATAVALAILGGSVRHPAGGPRSVTAPLGLWACSLALAGSALWHDLVPRGSHLLEAYTGMVLVAGAALAIGELGSGRREVNSIIELSDLTPDEAIRTMQGLSARTRGGRRRERLEQGLGLLMDNEALRRELESKVADVRASRARLVTAADEERRRLERTLAHGAVAHLERLRHAIDDLAPALPPAAGELAARCAAEVDAAEADLGQLARGLHPRTLTERGLGPALEELAAQAPLPVHVRAPALRYPEPVETALWYACSEALANVAKHAAAGSATISIDAGPDSVKARVVDDGVGGARVEPLGGLAGLRDRLATVGGTVRVAPGRPGGTVVDIRVMFKT